MRMLSTMRSLAIALLASALCANAASAVERRTLTADDINALEELDDPQVAPDGEWVAYTVRTADLVKDKRRTHIWMTSWNGERIAAAHAIASRASTRRAGARTANISRSSRPAATTTTRSRSGCSTARAAKRAR